MQFQVLGPVEAHDASGTVDLNASRARTVLASLLLARCKVVSDSHMTEMLWGDAPPSTASAQIQTYVSRLRQKLGSSVTIVRQRPGYLMTVEPQQVDLIEFERMVEQGRAALNESRPENAIGSLSSALAMWQGPPLGGVTEFLRAAEAPRLEETRLAVREDLTSADLALGLHVTLVPDLIGLVASNPLRERLRGQLMLALHRSGRQADALACYQDYQRLLAEELGIDPGQELANLHQMVLAANPLLDLAPAGGGGAGHAGQHTARLPVDPPHFTGREEEAREVVGPLEPSADGHRTGCVITGMAGVGKTALSVHAAHRLREYYPDGQVYLDLDGSHDVPDGPECKLAELLEELGVPAATIPDTLARQVRLYRNRLAGQRILIVLDNAADVQQVRPLLPDNGQCCVLVTSRHRLTALEGLSMIELDDLEPRAATDLLEKIVGDGRVGAEPDAAARIVARCGHLPLAVRIAGARLLAKPHWSLKAFAARLEDGRNLLDELSLSDLDIRSNLASSWHRLTGDERRALHVLATSPVEAFDPSTAADLLGTSTDEAGDVLEDLVDKRMLRGRGDRPSGVEFRFHDLIRWFAVEQTAHEPVPVIRPVPVPVDRCARATG